MPATRCGSTARRDGPPRAGLDRAVLYGLLHRLPGDVQGDRGPGAAIGGEPLGDRAERGPVLQQWRPDAGRLGQAERLAEQGVGRRRGVTLLRGDGGADRALDGRPGVPAHGPVHKGAGGHGAGRPTSGPAYDARPGTRPGSRRRHRSAAGRGPAGRLTGARLTPGR